MSTHPSDPLVSVVVPTYDRPDYLRRAVRSVVNQTYDEIELVVVDDNETTPARKALADLPLQELTAVEFVRGYEHDNAADARNTGVKTATGEFVAFLDDDDWWFENKLARQIEAFARADDDVGLVYTGATLIYDDHRDVSVPPAVEESMTKALLRRNVVGSMSVVVVRRRIALAFPFDEQFPSWEDLVWYVDLSQNTDFERIPDPLVGYEHDSPDRLSEDLDRERRSRRLFESKYRSLARSYGVFFEREMRAWVAFRSGKVAFHCGAYDEARRLLLLSVARYPFEWQFYPYLVTALGGARLHRVMRRVRTVSRRFGSPQMDE